MNKHNEELLDSLIRHAGHQVLIEAGDEASAGEPWDGDADVMENLDEKMRRVINNDIRRRKWSKFAKSALKVAVALLVVLMISVIAVASSEALRETIINMLISNDEEASYLNVTEEDNVETSGLIVTPEYLPDGYAFKETVKTDRGFMSIYENKEHKTLMIVQGELGMDMTADNERHESERITIGEYEAYIFSNEQDSVLVLNTDINTFRISGEISREEIINVAKSMIQ